MKVFGKFVLTSSSLLTAAVISINTAYANTQETIVDVMVLYTDAATKTYKGRDIDARIASYISYANKAYANSSINLKLRLVHSEKLKTNYYQTVNGYNLDGFRADSYVQKLRKEHGADIVTLVNLAERTNDGYITCGIGYVPQGYVSRYNSEGKFYYGASSQAYNLVGVDCGYNTFVHELGHNMGLGHSLKQKSVGGVYKWGRGYGEQGNFTTVMAYPYVFRATGLQQFSNPGLYKCNGRACGVEKTSYNGADSSENLNKLAKQISEFMPIKHPLETDPGETNPGETNPGSGNGTGTTQPTTPELCKKPHMEKNLLSQGDFNEVSDWSMFRHGGYLEQISKVTSCGQDYRLQVRNRPYFYSGPMQDVTDKVKKGYEYEVSAKIKLVGDERYTIRDDAQITLEINGGQSFQYLADASVTNKEFTTLKKKFKLKSRAVVEKLKLFAYGPQANRDFIIDEFKLVEVTKPVTPNNPIAFEESFENWNYEAISLDSGFYRTSYHASKGRYSLRSYNRNAWYYGPGVDVTGHVEANKSYQVSADVKLDNYRGTAQPVSLYLLYTDKNNPRRNYWHRIARKEVTHSQWFTLSGTLNAKGSQFVDAKLVVIGPDRGVEFNIDNIKVVK
ncbi:carbohydrate binding domain-containing protein [Endozoicomonas sp. SM1973]|uniref:endo-1,4-beta-xylanase n=1 Tax=Spartinivicinus marinus TaxID=2994442 RepID=A0A853IAN7_9GAMM|nr:carbohydrate binding domain-containing protein [Spartinivicinus marinus]MCX4026124.1 carbohydrate binding domain-containing protein [Spartinivicinus marinus]NYZ66607.1 carbohydrate binding domain-containing protein [Spartinivicinus marinus]